MVQKSKSLLDPKIQGSKRSKDPKSKGSIDQRIKEELVYSMEFHLNKA